MTKRFALFAALVLSSTLSACGSQQPPEQPPLEGARIGGPFTLTDKTGRTVHWSDFDGKYRIVYFGYTFCPDVCPTDLTKILKGFAIFAEAHPAEAAQVQPIFITIDPARDTPAVVGEYAAAFSPRLLGLTGSEEQIHDAAKAFAVAYSRGEDTSGGYLMNHISPAYLMGRKGEPIAVLPVDESADAVAAELAKWVQ